MLQSLVLNSWELVK